MKLFTCECCDKTVDASDWCGVFDDCNECHDEFAPNDGCRCERCTENAIGRAETYFERDR